MIVACISAFLAIGVLCLVWPHRVQAISLWWTKLGMYPFPRAARSPIYLSGIRIVGLLLIGLVAILLGSGIRS